jgi:hypothetical protein
MPYIVATSNLIEVAINCPANDDKHWIKYYPKDGICLDHFSRGKVVNWIKASNFNVDEIDFNKYPMWLNVVPRYEGPERTILYMTLIPTKFTFNYQTANIRKVDIGFYAKLGQPKLARFFAFDFEGEEGHRVKLTDINMMSLCGHYNFDASWLYDRKMGAPGFMDNATVKVAGDIVFADNTLILPTKEITPDLFILTAYEPSDGMVYIEATDVETNRTYTAHVRRWNYNGRGFTNFYPKNVEEEWSVGSRPYGGRVIGWGSYSVKDGEGYVNFTTPPKVRRFKANLNDEVPRNITGGILTNGKMDLDGNIDADLILL